MNKKIKELIIDNYFSDSEISFLNEIEKIKRLSNEEQLELVKKAQSGDAEARNELIKANLVRIANISSNYLDKGVDFLDLIQEGSIGLIKGINKFDVSKFNNFSKYAFYYISNSLNHVIKRSDMIRKPDYYVDTYRKLERITNALRFEYHREPEYEEIAKEMGISEKKVKEILFAFHEVDSLDRQIDEENTLYDVIPSNDDYFEEIETNQIHNELNFIIDDASQKYPEDKEGFEILKMRCGFDGDIPKTFKELGEEFGCSESNIWIKETKAIRKLRNPYYRSKVSGV